MSNKLIAFQGLPGAHSHQACLSAYPDYEPVPYSSFEEVFDAVEKGEAELGIVPVENSHAGRVAEIHNLLADTNLHIVAEHFQKIEHHLLGIKGAKKEGVKFAHSHPQALMQCRKSLRDMGLAAVSAGNTAAAASEVAKLADPSHAALAGRLAAKIHGLEILAENMEDSHNNMTIFNAISKEPIEPDPSSPNVITALIFTIRNIQAALYKSLGGFATNNVNMLKLESYIPGGRSSMAQFFISFQGHPKQKNVQQALEELGFFSKKVKLLGVYYADPERFGG